MGLLRNWWEEASAQINPFDGGKTAATVKANRAPSLPATLPNSTLSPQAQQKIKTAKYGVLAGNKQKQDAFIQSTKVPKFKPFQEILPQTLQAVPKVATGSVLAAGRVAGGIVQDTSGLVDLVSPGTGTSRVSKGAEQFNQFVDKTATDMGVNPAYRTMQAPLTAASFFAPGMAVNAAAKGSGAVRGVAQGAGRVTAPVTRLIDNAAFKLDQGGMGSRIAATGLKTMRPGTAIPNIATGTAMDLGHQSGTGQDVSGADVGISAGLNTAMNTGIPVAGKLLGEGIQVAAPTTRLIFDKIGARRMDAHNQVGMEGNAQKVEADMSREIAGLQRQQKNLDDTPKGVQAWHYLQAKIDRAKTSIEQAYAAVPSRNPMQRLTDKVMTAQPGMSMKEVGDKALDMFESTIAEPPVRTPAASAPTKPPVAAELPRTTSAPRLSQQPGEQGRVSLPDNTTKLNTERLNVAEGDKSFLDRETQETIDRIPNKDIQAMAKSAGIDTRSHTPEQTKAIIAKQLNTRQDAVKYLNQAKETTNPAERAELYKQAAERGRTSREQGTDVARQLQARKIIANELDTPEQRIFKLLDEAGVSPDVYSRRLADVDFANSAEVVKAYREMVPAKFGNWLDTVRYNSMLSSPLTQAVNIFGNAQGVLVAGIEKNLRGNIDAIGGLFGKPRQYARGEGTAYAGAAARSIGEASHNFVDALRGTGKYANADLEEYSMPLATKGIAGGTYKTLSVPMRVLDGMDKFFRTLAENGEEAALTKREGKGIAIKGNRDAIKKAEADYRVFQTEVNTPGQGIVDDAFDKFAGLVMQARNNKNPLISLPAKFTVPFVRTVNNIGKQGIVDYSPLGVANLKGNTDKTTAITRAIMGSAVFGASAALIAQGQMTWAEPRNADERAQFRAEGKQPYSVRVGDKWVNFSKLHPAVSFPMAMTAALHDAIEKKEVDQGTADAILEAISKYGNFLADQSYAKSIGDTLAALGGDKEAIAQAVGNNIQQLVPFRAFTGWIARMSDSTERKVDTTKGYIDQQVQALMQQYPGLRQKTPTRDNAGLPIAANNQVFNAFSPVRVTNDRTGQGYNAGGDKLANTSSKAQKADVDKQIKSAFSSAAGRKFIALKDADKKALAQSDPEVRAMYEQYQAMKKALGGNTELRPSGLDDTSTGILDKYDRMTTKARDKIFATKPDAQYQYELAKYESDRLDGKLDGVDDVRRQKALKKAQVGSKYDKDVRDIYSLSKDDIIDYVNSDPDGKRIWEQIQKYDKALKSSGLISRSKFGGSGSGSTPKDFSIFSGGASVLSMNKSLRSLVNQARLKSAKA